MGGQRISSLTFVDIVLGVDYCEIKVPHPDTIEHRNIEGEYSDDVQTLRKMCMQSPETEPEFTLSYEGLRFRVTTMNTETGKVWFLSRIDAQVRPIHVLPVPKPFVEFVLRPRLHGLILVTGGFGTGKTTTASSLFCHRIETLGGTGTALEDPASEVQMAGRRGQGRIISIPVSRKNGGYHTALQLVRRSRADFVLIGEIRDAVTAIEAQDIANTDMPVIATMHASSIEEAFDKYQSYLRSKDASSAEANSRLALSVAGIIHLTKEYVGTEAGAPITRYTPQCLILDRSDPSCLGTIGKIRDGKFMDLGDDITAQAIRRFHGQSWAAAN